MAQLQEVDIAPYVAAAIVEHAKRRGVAAGFLLGVRNIDNIHVGDFIPMTHAPPFADVTSKAYLAELDRRVRAKQAFVGAKLIGWYAAAIPPRETTAEELRQWCEAPAASFARRIPRQALYLHAELPTPEASLESRESTPGLRWCAYITRNQLLPDESDKARMRAVCVRVFPLRVHLTTQAHAASNVVLAHVRGLVMGGGENGDPAARAPARSELLNLDHVPARPEARLAVQAKLEAAIANARKAIAAPATHPPEAVAAGERLLAQLDRIRAIKEEDLETQHHASAREDMNTQRFKDALMIKCMVMLLRKEIGQISALAHQYHDGNRQSHPNANARNYV